jgi:hypothetical protein
VTLSKTGQTLPGRKSAPKNISSRLAFDSSGYKNENDGDVISKTKYIMYNDWIVSKHTCHDDPLRKDHRSR